MAQQCVSLNRLHTPTFDSHLIRLKSLTKSYTQRGAQLEKMKIAFLHTSDSHIIRFDKIVNEIDKTINIEHFVNEQLLETALKTGQIDKENFYNETQKIKAHEFKNIICTCSTYGELCNEDEQVYRIDKPIVELIVANFSSIGIAFTAKSTQKKSNELVQETAEKKGKEIKIHEIDCQHCWTWFEKGDSYKYEIEIANQIKKTGNNCDVIFLAQASMEGAKKFLLKEKYKTVSSPKFGVEEFIALIKKKNCS